MHLNFVLGWLYENYLMSKIFQITVDYSSIWLLCIVSARPVYNALVRMRRRHTVVSLCICVSVTWISWRSLKPSAGKCSTGTVQQYIELNSLRFLNKGFVHDSNAAVVRSRFLRRQICLEQISFQLETWINTTDTAADSGTMQYTKLS